MWAHQCGTANDQYFQISSSVKRDGLQGLLSATIINNYHAIRRQCDSFRLNNMYETRFDRAGYCSIRYRSVDLDSVRNGISNPIELKVWCEDEPANFVDEKYHQKNNSYGVSFQLWVDIQNVRRYLISVFKLNCKSDFYTYLELYGNSVYVNC